ncbi:MAG: Mut7-C RNAse domain-containing protein [Campylobacterota bacterium]|nr:Mut7-C RNAse domain-containing protein [Campylobacterota bacterium]
MKRSESPSFIADCHLGKVAKYLRMMGYNTLYFTHIEDDELIDLANAQHRIILTRDRELSERKKAPCLLIKATKTKEQLQEIIRQFDLYASDEHFSRCIVCNTPLQPIEKDKVIERIPRKIAHYFSYFEICPTCERIYWHGDHYKRMKQFIDSLFN